ncbi:hypothetical protein [Microbacterium sp. NPDC087665]|uniref:hypothetical protein n=1 Tax=Microbacterium sp. NPDC087665 TaxID=3364194 RepID=UPI00382D77B3
MTAPAASSPVTDWAAHVNPRAYRRSRHVLDEMVVSAVPEYAAAVDAELDRFDEAAIASRRKMDARYQPAWLTSTGGHRLMGVLLVVRLFAFAAFFAFVFPSGGRSGTPLPIEWAPTTHSWGAVLLSVSVIAQVALQAPYRHHVPPRDVFAWGPVVLGVPNLVWMFLVRESGIPTPPWALVLTTVALLVSGCSSTIRLARRRRDPKLTKKADAAAKERPRALRRNLLTQADVTARRIEDAYAALPDAHRRRLADELTAAAAALQERGLATVTRLPDAPGERGMFPGWLLLSHRVSKIGSRVDGRAEWFVGDYVDERVRTAPPNASR